MKNLPYTQTSLGRNWPYNFDQLRINQINVLMIYIFLFIYLQAKIILLFFLFIFRSKPTISDYEKLKSFTNVFNSEGIVPYFHPRSAEILG